MLRRMNGIDSTLPDSTDTLVVGAGPAGLMAAAQAARTGSVVLIDQSALPRDKSCGGMLNQHAQRFIASSAAVPSDIVVDPAYVNFRYHDWDRQIRKPTALRFLNVDRRGFDDWLAQMLPEEVSVFERAELTGFEQDSDVVVARLIQGGRKREVRCAHLVGADGARSKVRRALGIGSVATYVTLQDFCGLEGYMEPYFDCVYVRDIGDAFAYGYVVPKGDTAIVGSVFYPKTKRPYEKHDVLIDLFRREMPLGESRKREAALALAVRERGDVACGHGRVLLAGEAGGFMSPTSGEGISYALNSGALAGRAVADAAASAPDGALSAYESMTDKIRSNIERKLRWLPFMESERGKHVAGYVPTPIVSRITRGL
jgi:geranylgeranyl reductase family protein